MMENFDLLPVTGIQTIHKQGNGLRVYSSW